MAKISFSFFFATLVAVFVTSPNFKWVKVKGSSFKGIVQLGCMRYSSIIRILLIVDGGQHAPSLKKLSAVLLWTGAVKSILAT